MRFPPSSSLGYDGRSRTCLSSEKAKKSKEQGKKKQETPRGSAPSPCKPTQPPTKQRIPYHTHASLSPSHPPAWKREQRKKSLASKTQTPGPPLPLPSTTAHRCRSGAVACAPASKKEKHRLRQGNRPLLHGIASCAALRCQSHKGPRQPPRSTAWRRTTAVFFWSSRRA